MNPLGAMRDRYNVAGDPLRTERRVELVAVVLALLFFLQLLYSGMRIVFFSGPDALLPAEDALRVGTMQESISVEPTESQEIRARPLFWQGRRPVDAVEEVAEVETESASPEDLKGVKLQGVFGSGDTAGVIALVKDKKQRILLGEQLAGWTVESVTPDRVLLVDGEKRTELRLKTAVIKSVEPQKKKGAASKSRPAGNPGRGDKSAGGEAAKSKPALPVMIPDPRAIKRRS